MSGKLGIGLAVLAVAGAIGLIVALVADDDSDRLRQVSVQQILEEPVDRGAVQVTGRAVPLDDGGTGFVLEDDSGRAIWVLGPAELVGRLRPMERVRVAGVVERLTDDQAIELAGRVAEADPVDQPGGRTVVRARRAEGAVYLRLDRIVGER